ncbi:MAG: nitrite/sulfite reductase [Chloroflexi bacterium]|nr:nitrite/sulfite reductase [Chloroflexota bacterium]
MAEVRWEDVLRKNPRERMKVEEHPLDVRRRLPALAAAGYEAVSEEDLVRLQWFGAYHDKPRVGYFMLRVKIPGGLLTPQQCRAIGELAEQFHDYAELTTRQNVQLHWVRLDDLGAVLDRLEALGLLPYGGCGDAVRNLTGCPLAGYHPDEPFDATDDLLALARFFYDPARRDYLNLPRKHKITVAACPDHCNYPEIHDIAFVGTVQDGEPGYAVWIGGGLSTNPRLGRDLGVFVRREEALEVARAILDVWREPPENRLSFTKARIKFFVDKIGPQEYRRRLETRLGRPLRDLREPPVPRQRDFHDGSGPTRDGRCYQSFALLGGVTSGRVLQRVAALAEAEGAAIRLSQRQNLILAGIAPERLDAVRRQMAGLGFLTEGSLLRRASIACTSDPYCNYALNSSKQLLGALVETLEARLGPLEDVVLAVDGCPHACAHHWVGDIGLQASYLRRADGSVEEAVMVILGGGYGREAGIGRVVARRVPVAEVADQLVRLIAAYRRSGAPSFATFARQESDEALVAIMEGTYAAAG